MQIIPDMQTHVNNKRINDLISFSFINCNEIKMRAKGANLKIIETFFNSNNNFKSVFKLSRMVIFQENI